MAAAAAAAAAVLLPPPPCRGHVVTRSTAPTRPSPAAPQVGPSADVPAEGEEAPAVEGDPARQLRLVTQVEGTAVLAIHQMQGELLAAAGSKLMRWAYRERMLHASGFYDAGFAISCAASLTSRCRTARTPSCNLPEISLQSLRSPCNLRPQSRARTRRQRLCTRTLRAPTTTRDPPRATQHPTLDHPLATPPIEQQPPSPDHARPSPPGPSPRSPISS